MSGSRWMRIGASMVASLLLQARSLIISLVVFRMFAGPAEVWGTVSNVIAVVTVLALAAKLGLEFTGVQLVSKYRDDDPAAALESLRLTSALRGALALIVALPLLVAPGLVGGLVGLGDVPELVVIGAWLLITSSLYEFTSFLLSGTDNFRSMANARLVYTVVNVGGIALAASYPENGAADILWAQVAGGAAALLWGGVALWGEGRKLAARATGEVDRRALMDEIVRFSIPMLMVNGAGQLFSYLGRIVIPVMSDRVTLGHYALAESVVSAAMFGTYAFRNVARTRLPGLLRRDPDEARRVLLATYRANMVVAVVIGAGSVAVAPDLLVALYGEDARPAAEMLPWFVPYVLLSAHGNFSATALVSADQPRAYATLMGALAGFGLLLNVAFVPWLGGYGAILGGTLSMVPLVALAWRKVVVAYGDPGGPGVVR
ncbi:MAG TPA: oligosaccharide flippase family protein, partial [Myxococcota bacterium]|nr:oligosaccharide flippase family protein [Myxococcota bacterium]